MKNITVLFFVLLLTSMAYGTPGDILRSQSLAGQPDRGVRGLAMDWDTGMIWVAGPESSSNIKYTTMDPAAMTVGTWLTAAVNLCWVFDIGYGYESGRAKYLLMNDQYSPFTKMIDPTDGSYDGNLPDYYAEANYTDGCSVNWDNNYVYLSSYGDPDVVYYDGYYHNIFASISDGLNMGTAIGWEHLFILRSYPCYSIEVYGLNGTFIESIPLTDWPSGNFVMGISCGQENAVGDNETLFFCDFVTEQVHEIEVGDYTSGTSLVQSTWGEIKAGFIGTLDENESPSMRSIH